MFINRKICLYFSSNSKLYVFDDAENKVNALDGVSYQGTDYNFIKSALVNGLKYRIDKHLELKIFNTYSAVVQKIFESFSLDSGDSLYLILPDWFCILNIDHLAELLLSKSKVIIFPETLFLLNNDFKNIIWEGIEADLKICGNENGTTILNSVINKKNDLKVENEFIKLKFDRFLNDHMPYGYCVNNFVDHVATINNVMYNAILDSEIDILIKGIDNFNIYECMVEGPAIRQIYDFDVNKIPAGQLLEVMCEKENCRNDYKLNLDARLTHKSWQIKFEALYEGRRIFLKKFNLRDRILFGVKIYG
jgi:hypothetical protein